MGRKKRRYTHASWVQEIGPTYRERVEGVHRRGGRGEDRCERGAGEVEPPGEGAGVLGARGGSWVAAGVEMADELNYF